MMYGNDQAAKLRELIESTHGVTATQRVVAVASGKGGTGKSTLSVNMAIAMRRAGKRVLVIDADFGLANVDLMLGVSSENSLAQVLSGDIDPNDVMQTGLEGVQFLSGGSGVEALLSMEGEAADAMISRLLQIKCDADIILLDTGAGVNPIVLRMIAAANETVIVTTPEPTAVMDAYALIKTASQREPKPIFRLIVNRVENRREAVEIPEAIISLARKNLSSTIDLLGTVATDPVIPYSIKRQIPVLVSHPSSQVAMDIDAAARRLVGVSTPTRSTGLSAFITRLLRIRADSAVPKP